MFSLRVDCILYAHYIGLASSALCDSQRHRDNRLYPDCLRLAPHRPHPEATITAIAEARAERSQTLSDAQEMFTPAAQTIGQARNDLHPRRT